MALEVSCDGLYFPREPCDNVVTVRWHADADPLQPNTSVIFKVKCTAPHLFHVAPRYGALLLADAMGSPTPSVNQMATIVFGLREHHRTSGGDEDNGDGATPSVYGRSAASTARASSAAPAGDPHYQERFAIEYVMIKSEPLAFQQVIDTYGNAARRTEVIKNMWSLIASGAIPRAHLGVQSSVALKVFLENVVWPQGRGDEGDRSNDDDAAVGKTVVPPEARLVKPSAAASMSRRRKDRDGAVAETRLEPPYSTVSTSARRRPVDELRALKEEVNSMRKDTLTPGSATAGGTSLSPSLNTPSSQPHVREGLGPLDTPAVQHQSGSARIAHAAAAAAKTKTERGHDLLMRLDRADDNAVSSARKKGWKLSRVLVLMFALYVFLLFLRRGASSAEAAAAAAGAPHHYAVQVASEGMTRTS